MNLELQQIGFGTALTAIAIMAFASFVRSSVGFGEALIAMPLLALLLPLEMSAAFVGLVAMTVSVLILGRDWQHIQIQGLWPLVFASWAGIPLGFYLLRAAPKPVVLLLLASVLLAFCWYRMRGGLNVSLRSHQWAWPFGLAAGILGGAYNTGGPPVVIFGSLRGWTPSQFRATIQAFAISTLPLIVLGHWLEGRITSDVAKLFAIALPAVAAAVAAGHWVNRRLGAARFVHIVHGLLLAIAMTLIITAVSEWTGN